MSSFMLFSICATYCTLSCLDYVILILMDKTQITAEEMFARHANLE